ncbi:secretin receptor [Procambarus clarkii]|uniref:secretin receptor n=1 Tax=Procambarus clarkii TaxID=6728 RepID=UPI0037432FC1
MWAPCLQIGIALPVGLQLRAALLVLTSPTTFAYDPSDLPMQQDSAHHNHPESVEDQVAVLEAMREDCEVKMMEERRLLRQLRIEASVRITGDDVEGVAYDERDEYMTVESAKYRTMSSIDRAENESKDEGSQERELGSQVIKESGNPRLIENGSTIAYCPTTFDDVYCWPRTPQDTLVTIPCPTYVQGFPHGSQATRYCTSQGTWFRLHGGNSSWTNYTQCSTSYFVAENVNITLFKWVPVVRVVSYVGYSVSLATLIVAFTVLACIKRLRCPRNTLHMHLFLSFICRAIGALARDKQHGLLIPETQEPFMDRSTWGCRLFTGLWQYFILANYAWILMEGLYLHNLIFLALFTDNSAITLYIVLGWGLPLVLVVGWVTARLTAENTLCWLTNESPWVFWTFIRGPISVSIVVSFVLFLNIARELLLKLKSSTTPESRKYRYRRWARSTLVLVPLFGVHYAALLGFTYFMGKNHTMELIWLFTDQFFASFQGFFVATLYCLLNAEVRSELRKIWHHWWMNKEGENISFHSAFSHSRTYFSRGVHGTGPGGGRRRHGSYTGRGMPPSFLSGSKVNGSTSQENCLSLQDKSVSNDVANQPQSVMVNLAVVEVQQPSDPPTLPWYATTDLGSLDPALVLHPLSHYPSQDTAIYAESSKQDSTPSVQGFHVNLASKSVLGELSPPSAILYDNIDSCEGSPLLAKASRLAESTF